MHTKGHYNVPCKHVTFNSAADKSSATYCTVLSDIVSCDKLYTHMRFRLFLFISHGECEMMDKYAFQCSSTWPQVLTYHQLRHFHCFWLLQWFCLCEDRTFYYLLQVLRIAVCVVGLYTICVPYVSRCELLLGKFITELKWTNIFIHGNDIRIRMHRG